MKDEKSDLLFLSIGLGKNRVTKKEIRRVSDVQNQVRETLSKYGWGEGKKKSQYVVKATWKS